MKPKRKAIIIRVLDRDGVEHRFGLIAHQALNPDELCLPPDFYKDTRLVFPHFETLIVDPTVPKGKTGKLNYHYSDKDNEPYVCYPGSIPSEGKLFSVLKVWAVGQVCVLTLDRYLNEMIVEAGDPDKFLIWASSQGIRLSSEPSTISV
jgi:hypothetical protein